MGKKILKYALRALAGLIGIVIIILFLLYLPPVQDFIKKQALKYISKNYEIGLSVERLRLTFPLKLAIDNATVIMPEGDTILDCRRLYANVKLFPLIRQQVVVKDFSLEQVFLNYSSEEAGLSLNGRINNFSLNADMVNLRESYVNINSAVLDTAYVRMTLGPSVETVDTVQSAPVWVINADRLNINGVDFGMVMMPAGDRLDAVIREGVIEGTVFDMEKQLVNVDALEITDGVYSYLADTVAYAETGAPADTLVVASNGSLPWTVSVTGVKLAGNSFAYGLPYGEPASGLDINHISVTDINLDLDSVYYRGQAIRAGISSFSMRERSGLEVETITGSLVMDSSYVALSDFVVKTAASEINAAAYLESGLAGIGPKTPVTLDLDANIGSKDIELIYIPQDPSVRRAIEGKSFVAQGNVRGEIDNLDIQKLMVAMPGNFTVNMSGNVTSVNDFNNLGVNASLDGNFNDMRFVKGFIADTALRRRIDIPAMGLDGRVTVSQGVYSPTVRLAAGEGSLDVKGSFNSRTDRYNADFISDSFPLYRFLPHDSLGNLSMTITTQGAGFDPFSPAMTNHTELNISDFAYRGYNYGGISLLADYLENKLAAELTSESEGLNAFMDISALITRERQEAAIHGAVRKLELGMMGFTPDSINGSMIFDIEASASGSSDYTLDAVFDTIRFFDGHNSNYISRTELTLDADSTRIEAGLTSGDLLLDFMTLCPMDTLISKAGQLAVLIPGMIARKDIDADSIDNALPCYNISLTGGTNNILHGYMQTSGLGFRSINLTSSKPQDQPFTLDFTIDKFQAGGIIFDTVAAHLNGGSNRINYGVLASTLSSAETNRSRLRLAGYVEHNTALIDFAQRDGNGRTGFNIAVEASIIDSTISASVLPRDLILGYDSWSVNEGNYVSYTFNGDIGADLAMQNGAQHFILSSVDGQNGNLKLDLAGLDIAETLGFFPGAPEASGSLDIDVLLDTRNNVLGANGTIALNDLAYENKRIGNIGAQLSYGFTGSAGHNFGVDIALDGSSALTAEGNFNPSGADSSLNATAIITAFPLNMANPFLPEDTAELSGTLNGNITASGNIPQILVDGNLRFNDAAVDVDMIGTRFRLSDNDIVIAGNDVRFNNFAVIAPNNSRLNINGDVNLGDFSNMSADLRLSASDFQVVDVARGGNSPVYGSASLDLDATVKGPLDELTVRGNVELLGGTDVTYVMQDNDLAIQEQAQNIVTFVSFSDTTNIMPIRRFETKPFGMDMLVNVTVAEDAEISVFLSQDGQNRIDIEGGGELTYSMNQLGDTRLTGRYDLTGGTVSYNPPIISAKTFAIQDGSYIEWTGELMNPLISIRAVETLAASVTVDENNNRRVNFEISINIHNSLENMEITFDLAAPQDLTIQNELSTMTAEQRSTQAMNLLIYNTYTGPGTVAKASGGNPLNSFVTQELNRWAADNLKGVDLSFGIDSYDQLTEGGQSTKTDYSYQLSKSFFDNRVRTVIGGSISTDSSNPQDVQENLVDDISLEYMFSNRDNMYIKVFRHTGYESILEGEIIETGFGFVVSKRVQKLRDLFRLTRKKKQAAEQAAADAQNAVEDPQIIENTDYE